jgi:glycosyltransferase involved in cell wall biosynthesis
LLVRAFAKVAGLDPSLHLIIAGPDQLGQQQELAALSLKLAINQRISFSGMLTGDLKWGAFDACEVFVLPSHQENFGIVVAEALASAKPVLTTYQVNIWREIQDAGAGFIDEDSLVGTERLLARWLALSSEAREAMKTKAANCFEANFEIGTVADRLVAALDDVVKGPVSPFTHRGHTMKVKA